MIHTEIQAIEKALELTPAEAKAEARMALDRLLLRLPYHDEDATLKKRLVPIGVKVLAIAADVQFLVMVNVMGQH